MIRTSADLRAALDEAMLAALLQFVDENSGAEGASYLFPPDGLRGLILDSPPEGNA